MSYVQSIFIYFLFLIYYLRECVFIVQLVYFSICENYEDILDWDEVH